MKTQINNARRLLPCWLRVTSLMILSFLSIEVSAQTATFGAPGVTGSLGSNCGPITRTSATSTEDFSQHYYLYTAADMAAAGIVPGSTITGIAWYKANNGATSPGNISSIWKVHMKNSSTVPSPTWCNPSYAVQSAGATLVYNNTAQTISNAIGWVNLPLSTPFVYTGGSLEIGSNWNCSLFTGNPTTSGISWNQFSIPNANQTFGARGTSGSLTMINESCSPISQLVFTTPAPCTTITSVGSTLSSVVTACPDAPFNLTLQFPPPAVPGIDYLWESADDSDFTVNVLTLGTGSTQTASETTPKYYRCQVTCNTVPITAFSSSVFVDVYDPISVYAAGIDLSCHGDNLGEVYLSVSGGSGSYTYNWSNGANSDAISGLTAGTYSVVVTDGNGCSATTQSVLIEPLALTLSSTVTNTSASGANNGSIQLNAIGGTPPYEYSNDGGTTWTTSNLFSNLPATLYHCRVRDAAGCVTALDVTVSYPTTALVDPGILIDVSTNNDTTAHVVWGMPTSMGVANVQLERSNDGVNFTPIANGNMSSMTNVMSLPIGTVVPNGMIFLSTEQQTRFLFNENIPNLTSNTIVYYRARLSNASGSQVIYTAIKQFLPAPVLYQPWPILNPMPCPPIGIPPLGYSATNWLSSMQIGCCIVTKRLYAKYTCVNTQQCKDCIPACGCTTDPCCVHNCAQYASCSCTPWVSCGVGPTLYVWVVVGSVYTGPVITTTQTNVSCNGGSNGTITIGGGISPCKRNKIIGAPPCFAATHPLPWPNALGQISNVFTGLCAGCYTIMVKDCNGCTATKVVCITQPPVINLTATVINSCTCNGSIIVNATGGTPCATGYTYQKLPSGIPQSSNVFTNLCAGCYTIKVTDCNGCTKTIVKCLTGSNFNLHPVLVDPCFGTNNGSICIAGSSVTAALNPCLKYAIGTTCTPVAGTVFTTNPCFANLVAGSYCIKIVDTCTGCDTCICVTLNNSNTPCGKTNNIIVNTGYDPVTGLAIVPNGVPDPLWTVTAIGGTVFGPVNTVTVPGWVVNPSSHAIGFATDQPGQRIYRRKFKMCTCDSITFNLNIAYDNWLNGIYIDGVLVTVPPTITPVAQQGWTSNFTMFHNFTFTKYLCAGTHTIDIRVVNLGGPSGLNIFGTVTGTSNSIVTNVSPVNCCCSCTIFQTTPSVTNVSCNGGSNGSICMTTPVGTNTACWKYRIGTVCTQMPIASTTNPCFTGLAAGNYCVKITDTCTGCDTCICVSITQPTPITLTATSVNTCSCNGSITVTATGGTPCTASGGYTYQLLPAGLPQASNTFNGLCPGCYTIKVTDCNGCTATIVKCITASGSLSGLNAVVTNPLCNGGTGTICINNTTGVVNPCLKYRIGTVCTQMPIASTTNPCFTGLPAGNYCVKITDTCTGCDTCICVSITQPTPITLTATSVNTCSCNGSITVTAAGGTPCATGYTYQMLPGGPIQVSNTFNGLCPGCYTIKVTDCNGCTATIVKCITASGSLSGLNATVINPLCNGGTGTICINNTTGVVNPCLKYRIGTVCTQMPIASTTNPCFTGLPAGNYCVKITDTCSGCDTCICVIITQPTPITLTATSVNTCSCNGSITVTATGGTPCATGYTYQMLPGGPIQASNTFNGLCPGCYTIKVTDCNGCTATIVKCITASGSLNGLNATVVNPLCNGGTGTICINNTTGVVNPCLKYRIGTVCTQMPIASTTNPCFTGLPAGNYCVRITDTCSGCDTCICVVITQPTPITLTATSVNTCSCNGSITVTATGGTPCTAAGGYTYQLLPAGLPQASNTFNGLCPGCYTIKVTDCNGCTATIVKCITSVSAPQVNANVTNVSCFGGNNGTICIVPATPVPNPCLKYALATANCQVTAASLFTTNPCFTGLLAGNYCVKITDTCSGCDTCICVIITQPTPITLTATSVNTCSCNGSITVTATGGTPCTASGGYTYQLLPAGLPQASNTFNGLCPGCYTIKVTDCNGCTATIVKCITSVSAPQVNAIVTNVSCFGGNNGTICIVPATPVPNPCLKYALATANCQVTAASLFTTNPCFTGLAAGNYCVKITDTCTGCDTCICVSITQPTPITLTATSVNTCSCNGSITVTAAGGTPCATGYTYQMLPGGPIQASNTFNGLCPGCYTIKVTDCNGCTATIVKCITASGSLSGLNAVVTNPLCNGGTGTICINNTTGIVNPCLKYRIGTVCTQMPIASTTNPCFTGLPAGNYCVRITDTCSGCDTCICVIITQPTPITLTATSVNTCSCNGSITVTATGGTPCTASGGYTYQLLPAGLPQASNTFNGLCPGCYTIKVTDCNGCTATIVKCITSVSAPQVNAIVTNVSCFGGNNGTICIVPATPVPNPCLKYALATANCQVTAASLFTTNPCFTGLAAGNYCVKITDTCTGCDTCICVSITQPTPITLTATSVNTCSCNGSITVTAAGGSPCATGYTYQMLPGGPIQASNTFNGLCPGCYTIKVTDCNGCTATIVKCITASGSLSGLNAVVTNPLCNGGTGTICINNSTGTVNPCLKYRIGTVCTQMPIASTTNPCFTGLPAGNYCVRITDTCSGCDTCICVIITQPTPITLTATSVNTCSCNGSITVTATGGTPCTASGGYTYQLLPAGLPQASNTFNGLCPGCYTIKVTDCNGCTATIVKCITSVSAPQVNAIVTNVSCFGGNNGTICIVPATPVPNPCLKYALATANCQVTAASLFTTNPCFTGLAAGNYCVRITDTCTGCDTCICVLITQPTPITLTATSVNTCSCNGSITVTAAGGTPCATGYTYQLLPAGLPQASNTFNGLCPGCYTIKVTDCNGCTATIVKCITASGSLSGLNATVINPLCNGGTGTICINNSTGTVNPCLKYRIGTVCTQMPIASTTNPCFTNLPAGNYCVKITDTCSGCDTCICVIITQPTPITLTATSVNTCSCNGSITVTAAGGSPCATGYTYQMLPGGPIQASNTFNGLCPGCYTIKVTDCNGCTKTIVKCITASTPIVVNAIVINPLCFGANNGQIILNTVFNPCRIYRIGASCSDPTNPFTPNTVFTGLTAGNYCIRIKDTCTGCDTCICVTLVNPSPIIVNTTGINACPGMNNGTATANPVGGTMPYSFAWSNGQTTQSIISLLPGVYTVVVTDANGCTASATQVIGITPCNPVTVNLQAYLQGYYLSGNMMTPALYNQGTSTNTTLADEITVELHSATAPYGLVASNVTFLHTNGAATCTFNTAGPGQYYIVLKHKNTVQTWSSNPVPLSSTPTTYSFADAANKAYGDNMIEMEPGVWALYSGDITQDENVDLSDLGVFENDAIAFLYGYLATDINGDGTVDLLDSPIVENNINNFIYSVHP